MSKNRAWSAPGWPWELELLTLLFVAAAVGMPYYIEYHAATPASGIATARTAAESVLATQHGILWSIAIVALYIGHLLYASSSIESISTPFSHLISPSFFAGVAYYRITTAAADLGKSVEFVTGSGWQVAVGMILIVLFTLLIARIRMARHLLDYRDTKWDITSNAAYDSTYFSLLAHLHPLIYPPRVYRACDRGILVEGWYYVRSISFNEIQSMSLVNHASTSTSGYFLASSLKHLIRIELNDSTDALFISPLDRDDLLRYCAHYVARRAKSTSAGTSGHSGKTRGGIGRA